MVAVKLGEIVHLDFIRDIIDQSVTGRQWSRSSLVFINPYFLNPAGLYPL
jgi:hypothetical protein